MSAATSLPAQPIGTTACDRDPVHVPGTVQSHGMLLVLEPGPAGVSQPLRAISANVPASASGASVARLDELLDRAACDAVAAALQAPDAGEAALPAGLVTRDNRRWSGRLHRGADATLLELEPEAAPDPAASGRVLAALNRAIMVLRQQPDAVAACQAAVLQLRAVTGFDRVMAYRFMPDWSGRVIAESLDEAPEGIDSYLGLAFPASDIPAPARALYASNRLRLIPDVAAPSSPVRAAGNASPAPIDLSQAVLRGVAPVHVHYLANMKVRASMSVAIATPNRPLWGLIACHHQQGPLFVDPVRRQAAETIVQALSWRLAELAEADGLRRTALVRDALSPFLDGDDPDCAAGPADPAARAEAARILLGACDASGVAVVHGEAAGLSDLDRAAGIVPPAPVLRRLAEWLDGRGGEPLVSDRLRDVLPPSLAGLSDPSGAPICGLLATPLARPAGAGTGAGGWVLWFRPELRREVVWAGRKTVPDDPARALNPRASFAAWREEVADRSAIWEEGSQVVSCLVRDAAVALLARHGARAARANTELRRRNEEIRFFADAATHDLKEPLWQVQVLCGLIRDGLAELLAPDDGDDPARLALRRGATELDLETMAELVVTSAGRMRDMIDELARFAVAGRDVNRCDLVRLRQLADEALADLGEPLRAAPDATLLLHGLDGVSAFCDPVQMRRVFQNLFSNALKYRDTGRPLVLEATARRAGATVLVAVSDNGVGFDPSQAASLFEPFRRFSRTGAASDEGLGLGLSICQRIVAAHGGLMEAAGLHPGARFSFRIRDPESGVAPPSTVPGASW